LSDNFPDKLVNPTDDASPAPSNTMRALPRYLFLALLLFSGLASAWEADKTHVLLLNSYHPKNRSYPKLNRITTVFLAAQYRQACV
jgi:hypothetical protein